jgi:hypothetical protein
MANPSQACILKMLIYFYTEIIEAEAKEAFDSLRW